MSQRIPRRTVLGMGAAGLAGLAGCGGDGGGDQTTQTPTDSPRGFEIKVGMIRPSEGNLALFGEEMKKARDLALEQVDAIPTSHTLTMPVKDTDGSPESAVTAAQELVDEGFEVIVGPAADEASKAVIEQVLVPEKVLGISPFTASTEVLNLDDTVEHEDVARPVQLFYTGCPSVESIGSGFARPLAQSGVGSVSIIYEENLYGEGVLQYTRREMETRGLTTIAGEFGIAETGMDSYVSLLEDALADDPGGLLLAASPDTGRQVLTDYYANFGEKPIYMVDRMHLPDLPEEVESDMSNDAALGITPVWLEDNPGDPTTVTLDTVKAPMHEAWQYLHEEDPTIHSAQAYDCIMGMFLTVLAARPPNYEGPLLSNEIPTVLQPQKGQAVQPAGIDHTNFYARDFNGDPRILDIEEGLINNYQGPSGGFNFAMATGALAAPSVTMWQFAQNERWGFTEFDPFA